MTQQQSYPSKKHQTHKRARKKRRNPVLSLLRVVCIIGGLFFAYELANDNAHVLLSIEHFAAYPSMLLSSRTANPTEDQWETPMDESSESYNVSSNIQINSTNAVLMDLERGNVLFDKNGTKTLYPASMTKIMTAIVALEHINDLNEKVLLHSEMFQAIYNENASMAGFLPGESVRVIDLLYGLLLPSGAECAVGLAEYVAGSESSFVTLMNDKAREINMSGSNFTNTTGLHDNNHYSTAMDMAALFHYALANDAFYEIITSARYSTPTTNKHDGGITFYSTLFSKLESAYFNGGSILGGKTGYTDEAGQCLASFAVKDGNRYILVTSGAVGNYQTQELHIDDALTVYSSIYNGSPIPDTMSNIEIILNKESKRELLHETQRIVSGNKIENRDRSFFVKGDEKP